MTDTDTIREALECLRPYGLGTTAEAALDRLEVERDRLLVNKSERDAARAAWEVSEAECKSLAAERRETVAEWEREGLRLSAENRRLREALEDFADHGTRFDCNPTVMVYNTPEWVASQEWWQNRATQMDVAVRNRARAALGAPTKEGT